MAVNELINECETILRIGWNPVRYLSLAWYSFSGDFNYFKNNIAIQETDVEKFIKICDNRIERAAAFLQDVSTVLGFFITSLTIVLAVSMMEKSKTLVDPILNSITGKYEYFFPVLIGFLLIGVIILSILLGHYRIHIHAWRAFKEGAILKQAT